MHLDLIGGIPMAEMQLMNLFDMASNDSVNLGCDNLEELEFRPRLFPLLFEHFLRHIGDICGMIRRSVGGSQLFQVARQTFSC